MQEKLLRAILTFFLRLAFGMQVRGIENFTKAGDKTLIICNHQSFLDPLILAVLMPEKPAFAMNVYQADKWYFRWVEKVVKIYRLDPSQPMSMKAMLTDLKKGGKIVLFPEGRITTSGGIMKIYDGASMIAAKTGSSILPIHIDGAQFSKLSRLGGKLRQRWFPRISVTFFPPVPAHVTGQMSAIHIYDMMTDHAYEAQNRNRPVLSAIIEARKLYGRKKIIATDISRVELNYQSLFTRSFILSAKLKPYVSGQTHVAVLLPNSLAVMATFVSLHMLGKIPCMLNFSSGSANILHACHIAQVKTVLTSRAFIEKGKLEYLLAALEKEYVVIFLEDVRASISGAEKLVGALKGCFPALSLASALRHIRPYDPAVVLYTSGSEGAPKGVALSHSNILANIYQSVARFDLNPSDKLFNALPVFHSFGLTIGMLTPLVRGLSTFLYPSPLHYRVIPELIYDTDATIMVGTDTFYQGYAHYANPYDFRSIRLAVAGAEKLRDSTRLMFAERFGVSIMQGYGVTECSPVISCNTELYHKSGSVGRLFPGMFFKLEPVPGIAQGGRLWIKGPNVMLGYMKADQPGTVQPQGEWYDTGDIVDVDEDCYITILGRAKRFAKIGGEMVSLAAVEEFIARIAPDYQHAAIAIPDERKGEQVLLVTQSQEMSRQLLSNAAREAGFPEIFLPKQVVVVGELPLLGSGKIDYVRIKELYCKPPEPQE
jgi:acyl-[acyl-carrier-protein]-phospholipid O-acyltransferase/long-chain-fatty-acid--[acyl-carrier-protein] ligase